ncbi:MAG TPA: hypothetical protein VEO54_24725 [Thermoanaerobaculia bacterium]|nr:hypothetical protein [Thermoanaerobaculia bacterium]
MKRIARLIVPLVLLAMASPLYAVCGFCDWDCTCFFGAGQARCRYDPYTACCYNVGNSPCFASPTDPPKEALMAEYQITKVEVISLTQPKDTDIRIAEKQEKPAVVEIAALPR